MKMKEYGPPVSPGDPFAPWIRQWLVKKVRLFSLLTWLVGLIKFTLFQ